MTGMESVVVCIDDEPNILRSLERMFRGERFQLLTTTSPSELLYLVSSHSVSLVISDYRMEEITGLDLLKKVKEISPSAKRVILSGYVDQGLIDRALAEGDVDDYLLKPFERNKMREYVNHILHLSKKEDV